MAERMEAVKRAVETAFEEGARDYDELEFRANANLRRSGEKPATKAVILLALKVVDPMAWELSK